MAISFQSDEEVLRKLQDKLRKMTDEELARFGKEVRCLRRIRFRAKRRKSANTIIGFGLIGGRTRPSQMCETRCSAKRAVSQLTGKNRKRMGRCFRSA